MTAPLRFAVGRFITKIFVSSFMVMMCNFGAFAEDCVIAKKYYDLAVEELKELPDRRYSFERAVELCPSFIEARLNLGKTLQQLAQTERDYKVQTELLDKAAEQYEAVLNKDKTRHDVFVQLGRIYCIQGRYEMSAKMYEKAISLKPDDKSLQKIHETILNKLSNMTSGLVKADQIAEKLNQANPCGETIKTMGIEKFTVPKDRQRFNNITFSEWSYQIDRAEAIAQLQEIGQALTAKNLDRLKVLLVEGHTDDRGGMDRNQELSENRAESVKKFLMEKYQIDPSKITTAGYGYSHSLFPNDTPENRQKNRRVELVFVE